MTIRAPGLSDSPGDTEIQCSTGVDFQTVVESSTIQIDGVAASLPLVSGTASAGGTSTIALAEPYPATLPAVTNGTGTVVIGADSLELAANQLKKKADYLKGFMLSWDAFSSTSNATLTIPLLNGGTTTVKTIPYMQSLVDGFFDTPTFTGNVTLLGGSITGSQTNSGGVVTGALFENPGSGIGTSVSIKLSPNAAGSGARAAEIRSTQTTSGNYADLGFYVCNAATPELAFGIGVDKNCVTYGSLTVGANSGNISHSLAYNEDGAELVLHDETGAQATLLDQSSNNTRLLELINGSDLSIGLGASNTTGNVRIYSAGFAEAITINPSGGVQVNGPLGTKGNAIIGENATTASSIEIAPGRSVDGASFIDLVGDTTYTDYGLRLIRSGGANAGSEVAHRGTGTLNLTAIDAGNVAINTNGATALVAESNQVVRPGSDNTKSIGSASFRWSEVFAGNGAINTSDETLKTPIQPIEQLEKEALLACQGLIGKYQMLDSIETKGADNARWHFGVGAQSAVAEFESRGLDWTKYSFLCRDEIPVYETQTVTEKQQATETLTRENTTIKMIDGVPTQITEAEEYESPVFEQVGVVDVDGNPVMHMVDSGETESVVVGQDEEGNDITKEQPIMVERQKTHPVPVMVDVEVERQVQVGTTHRYGVRYEHLYAGILASMSR